MMIDPADVLVVIGMILTVFILGCAAAVLIGVLTASDRP